MSAKATADTDAGAALGSAVSTADRIDERYSCVTTGDATFTSITALEAVVPTLVQMQQPSLVLKVRVTIDANCHRDGDAITILTTLQGEAQALVSALASAESAYESAEDAQLHAVTGCNDHLTLRLALVM